MKILIADESPLIRKLIIEILGSENNEFAECEDSTHIPEIYTSFHPNFLIVDFSLKDIYNIVFKVFFYYLVTLVVQKNKLNENLVYIIAAIFNASCPKSGFCTS